MKIKVVNLKDIFKYLAKVCMIFGVIAIFANFFYSNRNITSCFSLDSTKFLAVIKEEIVLLKNEDKVTKNVIAKDYKKETLNSEFSMMKVVATNNLDNLVFANNVEEPIQEEQINGQNEETVDELKEAQSGVQVEVVPSNVPSRFTHEVFGVQLRNESDYELSSEITDLNVEFNKQDILLFHTHTCESYTPTEQYSYQATGTFRTTDLNYSVARVGDELEKYLVNYGYTVNHDKTYHDYPAYTGSYNRSLVTVKNLLATFTNTDIVIDLHRDAIGDNTYAPKVKIGDEYCARLMFVIGTDGGGLQHDNWRQNLKFAIKLQQKANELYPGLFKPIIVRNSRYNHQLANAACIIEVGATGNTLEECLNSMKYLSKIFNEM